MHILCTDTSFQNRFIPTVAKLFFSTNKKAQIKFWPLEVVLKKYTTSHQAKSPFTVILWGHFNCIGVI